MKVKEGVVVLNFKFFFKLRKTFLVTKFYCNNISTSFVKQHTFARAFRFQRWIDVHIYIIGCCIEYLVCCEL